MVFKIFLENSSAFKHKLPVLKESSSLLPVVLDAMSETTVSIFVLKNFIILFWVSNSVKSPFKNMVLLIGSISFISTDKIFPFLIFLEATCDQLPGTDPKSRSDLDLDKK